MESDANVRYRVVTGVMSTRGDPPFVKLTHAFLSLSKGLETGPSALQLLQYRSMCNEILSIEHQMKRHGAVQQACRREAECYAGRRRETEGAIIGAGADIEAAKGALAEAQTLRANLEEYERRKEDLMKHAGRTASVAEKQRVLDDVAAVQADSTQADVTLQLRRKQFATLLHLLEMLQEAVLEGPGTGGMAT